MKTLLLYIPVIAFGAMLGIVYEANRLAPEDWRISGFPNNEINQIIQEFKLHCDGDTVYRVRDWSITLICT